MHDSADFFLREVRSSGHHGGAFSSLSYRLYHSFFCQFFFRLLCGEIFWWWVQHVGRKGLAIAFIPVAGLAMFVENISSCFQIGRVCVYVRRPMDEDP